MNLRHALLIPSLLIVTSAVLAADYPARKPGLWETSVRTEGKGNEKVPAHVSQQCMDAASDKAMREMGMGMSQGMCSQQDVRNEGGKLVIDSVCKIGNTTATTHGVITGDFSSAYRMEMNSKYSPPMMGLATGVSVIEAKWLGPCKADQKPGDMVMANGQTINLMDMMKGQPQMASKKR